MKLLTLNCHSWQEDNQIDKLKIIAETIHKNDYDVIALQEVSQLISSDTVYDNIHKDNTAFLIKTFLEEISDHKYYLTWDISHIGFDKYEEGVAILSKYPLIEENSFIVSSSTTRDNWKTRKIICTRIEINSQIYDFYSVHLGWWDDIQDKFDSQIDKLLNYLDEEIPSFLMGDFNNDAFIAEEGYDYCLSKNLYDTYSLAQTKDNGVTIEFEIHGWEGRSKNKEHRIDWILTNKNLNVLSSKCIFNGKNEPFVSDHYGVEIEIEFDKVSI
ncbi:endonuclease/exonuclease/phosphatase family protein [Oceanirhabdus sp. W0125-5]|uniref:endonuclease/exonuclease/phosphatase family protein n=1 Tax=Oceanirhabdus sp. W0125-5 TaxID=2999116 RepID=UPI0022F3135A|nr:endonuclease/exonuclease/phosphatase family protein [Oceanirhabdus sp. W0125-5]WBW97848.1 endonuclease/exonuclease/phosphatase family protein [Oceanirhabdus sp. W0125-5]